jgi:hypothetical protein
MEKEMTSERKPFQGQRGTGSAGRLLASPRGEAAQRRRGITDPAQGDHFTDM